MLVVRKETHKIFRNACIVAAACVVELAEGPERREGGGVKRGDSVWTRANARVLLVSVYGRPGLSANEIGDAACAMKYVLGVEARILTGAVGPS